MEHKLERKDIRLIAICAVIAAISLLVGSHYFYQAFPEATIDFEITRDDARGLGSSFLEQRGLDVEGYRHSAIFNFDGSAKTFLERELGLEGASALIDDPVRLWRWSSRWVKEQQKEEFSVDHTTGGDLVGFTHLVEEELAGASLSQVEARYLAEQFLIDAMGRSMTSLVFVEAETTERPNRADHSFTWKLKGFDINDATYRVRVGIQGNLVGSYSESLKVPEDWQRDYRELRSRNQAAGQVASAFMLFTWVAMIVVLVINIRGRDVRWRTVAIFTAIAFVLTLLAQLNSLPVTEFSFDTKDTYGSFLTERLLFSVLAAVGQAVLIGFLVAGAEPVYRRAYGGQISLSQQFAPTGIRTKRFLIGTVIGLTLTAAFVAYQTVFYVIAGKFGAWSPADIPYSEMINTHIPWAVVLLIGFMPAVSEELTSRAFSIPFLHRFLKKRWAAVLISALIWGFAHAGYPQQPFYIRGVEVGIAGIVVGYIMLRWGLLPVLVWHYTIDALYTALILLRSSNRYFVITAALSVGLMLLPLLAAIVLYLRQRYFADPAPLLNREDSPALATPSSPVPLPVEVQPEAQRAEAGEDEPVEETDTPLPPSRLAVTALVVLASLAVFLIEVEEPFDYVDLAVTPDVAEELAAAHLAYMGVDAESYQVVTTHRTQVDGSALKYRMEREGMRVVDDLYREHIAPTVWHVRFFRPLEKEEYQVWIDPADSSVYTVRHLQEEEAPGADLEEEEALALAEAHMRSFGFEPESFDLKESASEKLKERRDYTFVWEAKEGDRRNLDESLFRCEVKIAGDKPSGLRRSVKLPEAWTREREESTALRTTLNGILIVAVVVVFFHLLWLLIREIRSSSIAWKLPLKLGAVAAALSLLGILNSLPTYYEGYTTETTTSVYTVGMVVQSVLGAALIALMITAVLGLMSALYPGSLDRIFRRRPSVAFRDALLLVGLVFVAGKSFDHVGTLLSHHFARFGWAPGPPSVVGLESALPFWSGLTGALAAALSIPIGVAILLFYVLRVLRRPAIIIPVILCLGVAGSGMSAIHAGEFYLNLGQFIMQAVYGAFVIFFLLRDNALAYLLLGFLSSTIEGSYRMMTQSASLYQVHGLIWLVLGLALLGVFWARFRELPSSQMPT